MYASINNLTTLQYFVIHYLYIYIDSLSCKQSLCTGIKSEGPISFKNVESVVDSHQFKTIHRLFIKKRFHCTTFSPAFTFSICDFSRANNIKKQSNIAKSVMKPVIEFSHFRKTDRFDCEIP